MKDRLAKILYISAVSLEFSYYRIGAMNSVEINQVMIDLS